MRKLINCWKSAIEKLFCLIAYLEMQKRVTRMSTVQPAMNEPEEKKGKCKRKGEKAHIVASHNNRNLNLNSLLIYAKHITLVTS